MHLSHLFQPKCKLCLVLRRPHLSVSSCLFSSPSNSQPSSLSLSGLTSRRFLPSYSHLPQLFYQSNPFNEALLSECQLLKEHYHPPGWISASGHVHTILGTALRSNPRISFQDDTLTLSDGGQVDLTWDQETPPRFTESSPILVIFPGITGGSNTNYVRCLVFLARSAGIRCVVYNYRGFYITPLKTPMVSVSVDVGDFDQVIRHVKERYPAAPIIAVGFSMGANMLVKYLGLAARSVADTASVAARSPSAIYPPSPLCGAVAVSNAFDYHQLARNLRAPLPSLLYSRPLARMIHKRLFSRSENLAVFQSDPKCSARIDFKKVLKARTLWDLDDTFTRHLFGCSSMEEYYYKSSSLRHLHSVATPLLCLNALDDPFTGKGLNRLPIAECMGNPHIIMAVTDYGGHCCWDAAVFPQPKLTSKGANFFTRLQPNPWMTDVVLQYTLAVTRLSVEPSAQAAAAHSAVQ